MIQRTLGDTIAISVPTAEIFQKTLTMENIKNIPDAVFFNVRTLWRNYWESWKDVDRPNARNIIQDFLDELDIIGSLMGQLGKSYYLFWPEYKNIKQVLPGCMPKEKQTAKSILFSAGEEMAEKAIRNTGKANFGMNFLIPRFNGKVWLVTHMPIDLLSRYQFNDLKLLQSHTGAVQKPIEWNKNIFSNVKYRHLPFNGFTMTVFGDKSKMLSPYPMAHKKVVLKLAEENNWTPLTTLEKIRFNIGKLPASDIKKDLINALRVSLL